jgi:hypothetical protein
MSWSGSAAVRRVTAASSGRSRGARTRDRRAQLATMANSQVATSPRASSYVPRRRQARTSASCTTSSRSAGGTSRPASRVIAVRWGPTHNAKSSASRSAVTPTTAPSPATVFTTCLRQYRRGWFIRSLHAPDIRAARRPPPGPLSANVRVLRRRADPCGLYRTSSVGVRAALGGAAGLE